MLSTLNRQPFIPFFCVTVAFVFASHAGSSGVWQLYSPGTLARQALSDVDLTTRMITVLMHSIDTTVPGSETDDGSKRTHSTSADISYEVGTEGIWFLFLKEDGSFYVNCHPQQLQLGAKEDEFANSGIFKTQHPPMTKLEWIKQRESESKDRTQKQARVGDN